MTESATGKRYCDLPGVNIRISKIPADLRPVLKVAREWSIVGDNALERAIRKAGKRKICAVVELAWPLENEIFMFALKSKGAKAIPVPHEIVLFQIFSWNLRRLRVEIPKEKKA